MLDSRFFPSYKAFLRVHSAPARTAFMSLRWEYEQAVYAFEDLIELENELNGFERVGRFRDEILEELARFRGRAAGHEFRFLELLQEQVGSAFERGAA